jgi:hypothetical protein
MEVFLLEVSGAVFGGLLLAAVFFSLNELVFPLPKLSGLWRFELRTFVTSYRPFQGMKLTFLVLLWQEGNAVRGTGEKVREDVNGMVRTYTAEHRSRIDVSGYVTRRFFRPSEIVIHFREHGEKRESSTMQTLRVSGRDRLDGEYASTVANSSGSVVWKRGGADLEFRGVA